MNGLMVGLARIWSKIMQIHPLEPGKLYLRFFHGRNAVDEQLDDWGFEGPTIGPLSFVHVTYMCDIKFSASPEVMDRFFPDVMAEWRAKGYSNPVGPICDWQLSITNDLIEYDGKYYGDWSVFVADPEPDQPDDGSAQPPVPFERAPVVQNGEYIDVVVRGTSLPICTVVDCGEAAQGNQRLLAAAWNSYFRNCGINAVIHAESDLLGRTLCLAREARTLLSAITNYPTASGGLHPDLHNDWLDRADALLGDGAITAESGKVYLTQGEHWRVPGMPTTIHATRDSAVARPSNLSISCSPIAVSPSKQPPKTGKSSSPCCRTSMALRTAGWKSPPMMSSSEQG